MKSRTGILILTALILAAVYAYKFTDWFRTKPIQIKYRSLERPGVRLVGGVAPVTFFLDKEYPVTSLKVISMEEAATNKYPHALWHVVAEKESALVADFTYGVPPSGMKSKIEGLKPEPLRPQSTYKLLVEVGKRKGEKEFQPRARAY